MTLLPCSQRCRNSAALQTKSSCAPRVSCLRKAAADFYKVRCPRGQNVLLIPVTAWSIQHNHVKRQPTTGEHKQSVHREEYNGNVRNNMLQHAVATVQGRQPTPSGAHERRSAHCAALIYLTVKKKKQQMPQCKLQCMKKG